MCARFTYVSELSVLKDEKVVLLAELLEARDQLLVKVLDNVDVGLVRVDEDLRGRRGGRGGRGE